MKNRHPQNDLEQLRGLIIGVGFQKTGTSSLREALKALDKSAELTPRKTTESELLSKKSRRQISKSKSLFKYEGLCDLVEKQFII